MTCDTFPYEIEDDNMYDMFKLKCIPNIYTMCDWYDV